MKKLIVSFVVVVSVCGLLGLSHKCLGQTKHKDGVRTPSHFLPEGSAWHFTPIPGPATVRTSFVLNSAPALGSTYIPVDSWVYPSVSRLYSLGYLDTLFLGLRPWTRQSLLHVLQASEKEIVNGNNQETQGILDALLYELRSESGNGLPSPRGDIAGVHEIYLRSVGIAGPIVVDSYPLGAC